MAVGIDIYPPILDTFMPAFLKGGDILDYTEPNIKGYKIYFYISDFNTKEQIQNNVQVTLVRQDTNGNVFTLNAATNGIKVTSLKEDANGTYIEILSSDLITEELITNIFYKVQIRFTSNIDENGDPISQVVAQPAADWFTKYLDCFSEWSTVCLIKGIETPIVELTGFDAPIKQVSSPVLNVVGKFTYAENSTIEKETLKDYKFILLDDNNIVIEDSGIISTNQNNTPNQFKYNFKTYLESDKTYKIRLIYETNNLYTNKNNPIEYGLEVQYEQAESDFTLTLVEDVENGIIQVQVSTKDNTAFKNDNIIVQRASILDNFAKWDKVHTFEPSDVKKHIFNDMTVESGVFYKYYAYYEAESGAYSPSEITEPIMLVLDYILLSSKDKQLKIMLDSTLNSVGYSISETKSDTIGGKYAIITRNGNMMYRTFPLGGLIHSIIDDKEYFASREELYHNKANYYEDYNSKNGVDAIQDIVYEKLFREKVLEFLYDGEAKLLRIPTEKNAIVKLMNNSFTPKGSLNNFIYSFSCSAVEIADNDYDTIVKFNLCKTIGDDAEIEGITHHNGSVMSGVN